MNTLKNTVVERFKKLCEEKNLNANALATLSGVTPSTVYSLFDGRRKEIKLKTIKILCDGLEITLAEFFDTDEFNALEQEIM
ncbi:MAG: helix-turn-helix domain-containing protein [Oscillospiraceae bacterium]|nr:helix-turn-helix domain-containing protein [Oscillospiraceae bacterium]